MTDHELDNLDRLLAEKVMGWRAGNYNWIETPITRPQISLSDWHPTRDIAQAFMVVEKIGGFNLYELSSGNWLAAFWKTSSAADNPALAISLAAQAWLESK